MKTILNSSLQSFVAASPDSVAATFYFPASLDIFRGHFPKHPIVPGVLEVEMIRFCAEKHLQKILDIKKITKAKFLKLLLPDTPIAVELGFKPDDSGILAHGVVKVESAAAAEIRLLLHKQSRQDIQS